MLLYLSQKSFQDAINDELSPKSSPYNSLFQEVYLGDILPKHDTVALFM